MTEQVPVSKLQDWVRKSVSTQLSQAERDRDKTLAEIARAKESLAQICTELSKKAERDMEKRENRAEYRATKAVVRLTSILENLLQSIESTPAKDTTSLRNLQRQTSKIASDAAGARQEWLKQIRPYFIIDMMTLGGHIDKLRRLGEELHSFLVGRGSVLRSLEELNEKLEALSKLELSSQALKSERESLEKKLEETSREEKELRAQMQSIKSNPRMKEYLQIDSQLKELRGDLLRTGFSRLGRPLRKLISLSERGDYPLQVDVREKLKQYARKPFTTFLKEDDGYPQLKAVLTALSNAVSSGKLALKQREAKKVIERTELAVNGESLRKLHSKSKELKQIYDQLLADQEMAAFVQRLRDIRQKGRANHKLREELDGELERAVANEKRLEEQVNAHLKSIETFVADLTGTIAKLARE